MVTERVGLRSVSVCSLHGQEVEVPAARLGDLHMSRFGVTCEGVTVLVSGLSAFATVRKSSAIVGTFDEAVGAESRINGGVQFPRH